MNMKTQSLVSKTDIHIRQSLTQVDHICSAIIMQDLAECVDTSCHKPEKNSQPKGKTICTNP